MTLARMFGILLLGAGLTGCQDRPAIVHIHNGVIRGVHDSTERVTAFLGIPYASPPTDSLRWRPPRPAPPFLDTLDASRPGASCPQPPFYPAYFRRVTVWLGGDSSAVRPLTPSSEDCLTLNVWSADLRGRVPVMVYIHGGGGVTGSGIDQVSNGTHLARRGVVVVTFNYRLGPLGFLAHPALSHESGDSVSGNYALLDMVLVLQWVRDNIQSFGGDPARVTIWGQSAGASFVGHLMTMPAARGLFHRAIAQSGTGLDMALPLRAAAPAASGEALGLRLAAALGIPDTGAVSDRLRALRAEDIVRTAFQNQAVPDGPVVDAKVLPVAPHVAFERGEIHPVPLLVGSNARELTSLRFLLGDPPESLAAWEEQVARDYGPDAPVLKRAYLEDARRDPAHAAERLLTDQIFAAPALLMAEGVRRRGQPAYLYQFAADVTESGDSILGSFHGAELPYLFGMPWPGLPALGDRQSALSRVVMDLWISFANRGDPNGGANPAWPVLDASHPLQFVIADRVRVESTGDTSALRVLKHRVAPE